VYLVHCSRRLFFCSPLGAEELQRLTLALTPTLASVPPLLCLSSPFQQPRWTKQTLLHKRFYTVAFYTQKLSHTAHRSFVHKEKNAILPQFLAIDHHFVRKGCNGLGIAILPIFLTIEPHCERVAPDDLQIALLPQFLAIEPHFVRKGCAGHLEIAILPLFLTIEPHFVRKSCAGSVEIAILPQFLAIEPHFVRKGCVSCRLVGTAPAPASKRKIEKKERARGQEGKRRRCEMRRCEDEKM